MNGSEKLEKSHLETMAQELIDLHTALQEQHEYRLDSINQLLQESDIESLGVAEGDLDHSLILVAWNRDERFAVGIKLYKNIDGEMCVMSLCDPINGFNTLVLSWPVEGEFGLSSDWPYLRPHRQILEFNDFMKKFKEIEHCLRMSQEV